MIKWIKARCVVCVREYEYVEGGYQPKTCSAFECAQKFARRPERYMSFHQHVDECRIKAGI